MKMKPLKEYNTLLNYHTTVSTLRSFFLARGFLEINTQARQSILAACEDPATIATYTFAKTLWPLPQTGQMWLEYELLKNPDVPGLFCMTTSYRDEPNPIPERHLNIFSMFEFETQGTMADLELLIYDLCSYLKLDDPANFKTGSYDNIATHYGVNEIKAPDEMKLWHDFGPVFLLQYFPFYTSPFFNMKKEGDHAKKIDTILYGMETIGSAERSCDVDEMRELFYTISNGGYSLKLFELFGKERVEKELNEFLSLDFFPRFGGGIGTTRLIRAITLAQERQAGDYIIPGVQPVEQLL